MSESGGDAYCHIAGETTTRRAEGVEVSLSEGLKPDGRGGVGGECTQQPTRADLQTQTLRTIDRLCPFPYPCKHHCPPLQIYTQQSGLPLHLPARTSLQKHRTSKQSGC
eukprot:Hpha_TRINITY_DN12417_c0_g1::TRINITY_DN12417_c0_g1_i1::g.43100::m.43100